MQTSKSFFTICAIALCAGSLSLAAQDTPAQAKAREALRQKMWELDAPQAAPPTQQPQPPRAVAPATAAPKPVVTTRPATVMTQPGAVFAPVPPSSDEQAAARAREALRQKMSEIDTQPQPTPPPTEVAPATKPAPAAQPRPSDVEKKRAAAEAKERKEAEKAALAEAQKDKKRISDAAASGFKALEAPALPISAEKQALLAELLKKYKADEITPEEYFKQKAKILADQ